MYVIYYFRLIIHLSVTYFSSCVALYICAPLQPMRSFHSVQSLDKRNMLFLLWIPFVTTHTFGYYSVTYIFFCHFAQYYLLLENTTENNLLIHFCIFSNILLEHTHTHTHTLLAVKRTLPNTYFVHSVFNIITLLLTGIM